MLNTANMFLDIIISPKKAFQEINEQKPLIIGAGVYLIYLWANIYYSIPIQANWFSMELLMSIVNFFLFPFMIYSVAEDFKGEGDYKSILSAYGFTFFPFVLLILWIPILGFSPWDTLTMLLWIGLFAWSIILLVIAIQKCYKVSIGTGIRIVLLSLLYVTGIYLVVGILVGFISFLL